MKVHVFFVLLCVWGNLYATHNHAQIERVPVPKGVMGLSGNWSCPAAIALPTVANNALNLRFTSLSRLNQTGHYQTQGRALIEMGMFSVLLNAQSLGRWAQDNAKLTLTIETLTLSPGQPSAQALQQELIQQLYRLMPDLPHEQSLIVVRENGQSVLVEDAQGQRYQCDRL